MKVKMGDHKPVSAFFVAEISVIDEAKYKEIHEELLRKMDKQENEYLPQVTIDKVEFNFDLIKFEEPQVQELIIANTGVVSLYNICLSLLMAKCEFRYQRSLNLLKN